MRATAVEGVTLVEGIHIGHWGEYAITIQYPEGFRQEIPYQEEAVATPVLIDAMLEEIGIEDPVILAATKEYCLTFMSGWNKIVEDPETDGAQIRDLRNMAWGFVAGYERVKAPVAYLAAA